jgi:aldehyde dehydrogenase (NAD+)
MIDSLKFYIDGSWVQPISGGGVIDVVNPSTEATIDRISAGTAADVDRAVAAALRAFASFSVSSREERLDLLDRIIAGLKARQAELADIISRELGAPAKLASGAHVPSGVAHFKVARDVLAQYEFEEQRGTTRTVREPIGVCGLITPWNWPLNQIACKVAPALAAGCTMVLKPSEVAPLNAMLLAEILHDAGVPPGVFNLVNGDGPTVGQAIVAHKDVQMVSFTGSTRAGIAVAQLAANTVKRVTQELGGKSANIILDDADIATAVKHGVRSCFNNSGQSCNAPTRMFVPRAHLAEAENAARDAAQKIVLGEASADGVHMGPVVSALQFERIQQHIADALEDGAQLISGGLGRPAHLPVGYFVQPTVFSSVHNTMRIAQTEVFGPVLCMLPYDSENEAIALANDSPYGLAAYVSSSNAERAMRVARQLRAGNVHINNAPVDHRAPFGGFKQSGNGREWGVFGFEEFLEVKAIMGVPPA